MSFDRRTLLKYGLGGAALLTAGGIGLALRPTAMVAPARPLRALTEQEFSILVAFAEAVLAGDDAGEPWPDARELEVSEEVDAALALYHPGVLGEVKSLLALLESAVAGLLLDRRIATFSGCDLRKRVEVLESWRTARVRVFRTGFQALHGFVVAAYYNRPETHARIGYPGVPDWVTQIRTAP